jgi:hypothetical protein
MMNSGSAIMLIHPLLRDQGGARVASPHTPWLYLYRSGSFVGSFNLLEHLANPEPIREIPITSGGSFRAMMTTSLHSQVSSSSTIVLGFKIPSSDMNPPTVTGLVMPQRFVPGEVIPLEVSAADDVSLGGVALYWKPSGMNTWQVLAKENLGSGRFGASIQTSLSDRSIDIRFNVTDSAGNYLDYSTVNASMKQVPISFDLSFDRQDIGYIDGDASVLVTGHLTDENGNPLHTTAAVPIDLMVDGKKVAMILDEYVEQGSHSHNGAIRFDWHFNPARLFSGNNQTIEICADVDLGTYQLVSERLYLHSVNVGNSAPVIRLLSPANGSMIAAGQFVDLSIWDDGTFDADAYLDGAFLSHLASPWDIDTSTWDEGTRMLRITAIDDEQAVSTAIYEFDVDANAPSATILYPIDGSHVPLNSVLRAEISDTNLLGAWYSVDGLPAVAFVAPYELSMTGWTTGPLTIDISASDTVGHVTHKSVSFVIVEGSVAIAVLSPLNGSVVHSGTPIVVSVSGDSNIQTRWTEIGVWQMLGPDNTIPTTDWPEGLHEVLINATNDLGEFDEYNLAVTIDDTPPTIVLDSPSNNSFVDGTDVIYFRVIDANLLSVAYILWNTSTSSTDSEIVVSLDSSPSDGYFELRVNSSDKAGNEANATFSYAMDTSPPFVYIEGVSSGDAIKPGPDLNVSAIDTFLSAVQWSLDGGTLQSLTYPYEISTESFSSGWHELQLVANDYSGKQTVLNLSLYADVTPPTMRVTSANSFVSGDSLEITANVTDDYGVGAVKLFYELQDGGYESIAMSFNGSAYVVQLASNLLWDGMAVYVVAEDEAGNTFESPHIGLSAKASSDDGPGPIPDNKDGGGSSPSGSASWAWFGTLNGLLMLGLFAAEFASIGLFYISRKNKEEADRKSVRSPFSPVALREPVAFAAATQIGASVRTVARAVSQKCEPKPRPAVAAAAVPGKISLIEAIPGVVIRPSAGVSQDEADDIDYGELIERELNISALKRSVFRKELQEKDVGDEFNSIFGGPQITSGLMLMKLMDIEKQKM